MKKNKTMRAAGILFIAAMLTTCLTAGTFAKYTTSDNNRDSARVAKFGITIAANGSLFSDAYANAEGGNIPVVYNADDNGSVTVKSSDNANVVAPGTKSDGGLGLALSGTAEVDVKITGTISCENVFLAAGTYGIMQKKLADTVTETNFAAVNAKEKLFVKESNAFTAAEAFDENAEYYILSGETALENDYYPVVYTMDGSTDFADGDTTADSAKLIAADLAAKFGYTAEGVQDTANAGKYTFDFSENGITVKANTEVADALELGQEYITWEWIFETNDKATDKPDTVLGTLQAANADAVVVKITTNTETNAKTYAVPTAGEDYNLTTGIDMTLSATQID